MAKANDIIKKAVGEIGVKENPSGSNNVKYNTEYYGGAVKGSAYPWCCAFIWWIFKKCNASKLFYDGKKTAYCPAVESWGKSKKLTVERSKGKPGDIILFDFYGKGESVHIGIIEKVVDNKYQCIEGNTSSTSDDNGGAVMRRLRPLSVVRCIIRPKYDGVTATSSKEVKTVKVELPVLKQGSKGRSVGVLQTLLKALGYKDQYGNALDVDNDFGKKTAYALKKFQKAMGLTQDEVCGKNTWNALLK